MAEATLASPPDGGTEAIPAAEWMVDTAVSNWNVGPHLAVATDPETAESFISFYDRINGDLYLARTGAPGSGNCGPIDLFYTWVCEAMDGGGAELEEADAVSIALNLHGEVTVAYRELNNYPFPPEGSVKMATECQVQFTDGFESGDTSAWSAAVP